MPKPRTTRDFVPKFSSKSPTYQHLDREEPASNKDITGLPSHILLHEAPTEQTHPQQARSE